ncbi:MAG: Ig-like domain-containing protein [Clostridia bacterium]|nr:Ig-like domain-containing protein [Clostridia bacterium]
MNFKKLTAGLLLMSLLTASAVAFSSCNSGEADEMSTAPGTEASTPPAETQAEETEPATEATVKLACNLTVTDQDGTPIPNATAYLSHKNGQLAQIAVQLDENGKATVTLPTGAYTVTYENLPEGHLPDDTTLTVAYGTADYTLKVLNNIPNGTAERPFTVTDETTEVKIPAKTSYTYVMFNAMDRTIVIENTTLKVSYKSVEYAPDENGTVSVLLTNESPRDPGYFTLVNEGDAEVSAIVNIQATAGSMNNPYVIEALGENVVATVPKSATVYYKWTATQTGVLMLTSTTPNNYIAMSNLANSTVSYFTNGGAATYLNVTAGDEILISVASTKTDVDSMEVTFKLTEHTATVEDSIPVLEGEFAFTLTAGASYSFTTAEGVSVGALQVKGQGIKVNFNGETLEPDEKGVVDIQVIGEGKNLTLTVENQSSERQEITVSLSGVSQS